MFDQVGSRKCMIASEAVNTCFCLILNDYKDRLQSIEENQSINNFFVAPVFRNDCPGLPQYNISHQQIAHFVFLGIA